MSTPVAEGVPSLKERQRREREVLILAEAERMLGEHGYHNLVMEELAERVGIGKGTIYLHFPRKEDLILAIFERGMDALGARLTTAGTDDGRTALERLQRIMRELLKGHHQWMHWLAEPSRQELVNVMRGRPDLRDRFHRQIVRTVGAVIDQGKATGEIDPAISAPVAALGMLALMRVLDSTVLHDYYGLAPEQVMESAVHLYFNGIRPRPSDEEVTR